MDMDLKPALFKLLAYCRSEDWSGYDPYDSLNSGLFRKFPFLDSRLPRIALTQALKRSPVNIRSLVQIPKTQNPKALALFLGALLQLNSEELADRDALVEYMIGRITELRSQDTSYDCWGYSFPWQTRTILVPKGAANLVCTTFVASALLDAYERNKNENCLRMAVSAAEYILNDLYWSEGEAAGFSYPLPQLNSQTHNASLLAAALLCRVAHHTGETKFIEPALQATRYAVSKQHDDGSWFYGESLKAHWVDNFHTGYNLGALQTIGRVLNSNEFEEPIRRGFIFYRDHFFRQDAAPKYFHNNPYPLDIHCVAQSILTLLDFEELDPSNIELAYSVFRWAMKNMWDERGFFYYRVLRSVTIRTSYMRWSQAWMLLAMSRLWRYSQKQANYSALDTAQLLVAAND